jgi:hypothetical protein
MAEAEAENYAAPSPADCHAMLLNLAGKLPDELITRCRIQLAEGAPGDMARAVMSCVLSQRLRIASSDVDILYALVAGSQVDPSALASVDIDDSDPVNWYFVKGTEKAAPDQVLAEALAGEADAIGCWRARRVARFDDEPESGKLVFVVEARADADMAGLAARLQEVLAGAGEVSAQVEVYSWDLALPIYQRQARGCGELIWAQKPDPGLLLAPLFDDFDEQEGPRFHPDHPRLEADEASKVAQYLREAEPVLVTSARMDDVIDSTRQFCVPANLCTDGAWIWTDALAYYAQEYLLEPDPGLLAHVRSNNYIVPDVDGVAVHRALEALEDMPDEGEDEDGEDGVSPETAGQRANAILD